MTHTVGIDSGIVALYRDVTGATVSDNKTEWPSHHIFRNNIRNNATRQSVMTIYDMFPSNTNEHDSAEIDKL